MLRTIAITGYWMDQQKRMKEIRKLSRAERTENVAFSRRVSLPIDTRRSCRSLNTVIFENRRDERERFIVSLLEQKNCNYFVPDHGEVLYQRAKGFLEESGYLVLQLKNLEDIEKIGSMTETFATKQVIVFYDFGEVNGAVSRLFYTFFYHYYHWMDENHELHYHQRYQEGHYHISFLMDLSARISDTDEVNAESKFGFHDYLSSMRPYRLSYMVFADCMEQFQDIYGEYGDIVRCNCDVELFLNLGCSFKTTQSILDRSWGCQEIYNVQEFDKKSGDGTGKRKVRYRYSFPLPKELLDKATEEDCVVLIRGYLPILDKKMGTK